MYELDPTPEVQKKSLEIATSLSESYTGITRLVQNFCLVLFEISPFPNKKLGSTLNLNSIKFPFEIAELY